MFSCLWATHCNLVIVFLNCIFVFSKHFLIYVPTLLQTVLSTDFHGYIFVCDLWVILIVFMVFIWLLHVVGHTF